MTVVINGVTYNNITQNILLVMSEAEMKEMQFRLAEVQSDNVVYAREFKAVVPTPPPLTQNERRQRIWV